ncbi:MliC family protein [Microbulbifer magnicolonia]|uniref:MliC family protein n=1 Tax=Microbulbifer magnicolonia TaxID=3109744 RepID=UPI002B407CEC|nr:MliC family protein [Microbulbifer sp. GG15]
MTPLKVAALTAGICAILSTVACEQEAGKFRAEVKTVDYRCENGERLQLKYVIPTSGEPNLATLSYRNQLIPMHQEPAASGVLYVADKGQPGYRWHTKGDEGILLMHTLGNGEVKTILQDCRSVTQAPQD